MYKFQNRSARVMFFTLCAVAFAGLSGQTRAPVVSQNRAQWKLVWSDEFNGAQGSAPDPSKWKFDIGGRGWGTNEVEYDTSRAANAHLSGGNLVIQARRESYTGLDHVTRDFTSARLKTQGLFEQAYGRFEARIKIPRGQGLWPAFWLLGGDYEKTGWPACGEIDIMENLGNEPSTIHGTVHGPGYSGGHGLTSQYVLPNGAAFADDFHLFSVEWERAAIRFYVDGVLYKTVTPAQLPAGTQWVFNHPFFIILDLAIGGDWPGPPDATTVFPQAMLVDYVRVYRRSDLEAGDSH